MAKVFFYYGAMGSSKTANALIVRHNYIQKGMNPLLLKPQCENRDGERTIRSRVSDSLQAECDFVEEFYNKFIHDNDYVKQFDAIIIDEAQFMTPEQVDFFTDIADDFNIEVLCYGLRTDFQSKFFPGSARLFEVADEIIELSTICWCGCKARYNARVRDGKIVRDGEQVVLGGDDSYVSVCRKHYKLGLVYPS